MPDIFLLISDAALREAVVEQIKAAKLGEPRILDAAQAEIKQKNEKNPSIVIVDEAGTDKKTVALLNTLNENTGQKPILLLLGETDENEGVNETFAKPLRLGHLMTRLRYYLETAPLLRDCDIFFGPYRLEPQNRRLLREGNDEPIRLTEKETALLVFLASSKQPATRPDILAEVWGYDERIDTHTLETHVYQLRRKIEREGENWLINENGAYLLARGRG
jgi:DNA-binding response OmpR family regulator